MDEDIYWPLHGVNFFYYLEQRNLNVRKRLVSVYQGI